MLQCCQSHLPGTCLCRRSPPQERLIDCNSERCRPFLILVLVSFSSWKTQCPLGLQVIFSSKPLTAIQIPVPQQHSWIFDLHQAQRKRMFCMAHERAATIPKVPLARSCRNKELEEDCCLPVDSNGLGGWCSMPRICSFSDAVL